MNDLTCEAVALFLSVRSPHLGHRHMRLTGWQDASETGLVSARLGFPCQSHSRYDSPRFNHNKVGLAEHFGFTVALPYRNGQTGEIKPRIAASAPRDCSEWRLEVESEGRRAYDFALTWEMHLILHFNSSGELL